MNVHSLSNSPRNSAFSQANSVVPKRSIAASLPLPPKEFGPTGKYLIGVSGGRDSVALLHRLVAAGFRNLHVCHIDHGLRGRTSAADAKFVEKLAAKYSLGCTIHFTDMRKLARREKKSVETAAREARYSFFAAMAEGSGVGTLFLAHHADDQVETFLMNLFRGAGTAGLTAMREQSVRKVDGTLLLIVRPLLGVWRADIDRYVKEHRLKFREDASNRDLAPVRNRVRRRVIPYLEKTLGRDLRQNIWRTARIAAEEEAFFEMLLPNELADAAMLAVKPLQQFGVALQRRVLHKWLRGGGKVTDVGFDLVERVRGLLDLASGVAKTNLPGNKHARRRSGRIFIE